MRVALRGIDGVDSVDVSLERGLAVVRLAAPNRVTLEEVREAIRRNGFTPKAAELRVAGRLVRRAEGLTLDPGEGAGFIVVPADDRVGAALAEAAGGRITVEGVVPETRRGDLSPSLEVQRITPDS